MNKKYKGITILVALFLLMLCSYYSVKKAYFIKNQKNDKKIILIDPGHGGMDGGAVSKNGTVEKDINLSISLKIKDELIKKGYKVIMTREEDKGLYSDKGKVRQKKIEDLNNRCKMRKDSNCNIFISIHLNMFPQSNCYGAQVWYSNNDKSKKLASIIQNNFKLDIDKSNNRLEKPAGKAYKILRNDEGIPSVIVECGFLSNPEEESKLKTESYQKNIATTITKSVDEYFR